MDHTNPAFKAEDSLDNWKLQKQEKTNGSAPNFNGTSSKPPRDSKVEIEDVQLEMESDDVDFDHDCCSPILGVYERGRNYLFSNYWTIITILIKVTIFIAYLVYFVFAMIYEFGDEGSIMLLVITICMVLMIIRYIIRKRYGQCFPLPTQSLIKMHTSPTGIMVRRVLRYVLYFAMFAFIVIFLTLDVLRYHPDNLHALVGIVAMLVFSVLASKRPSKIKWYPIFWGFAIQFILAYLVIRTDPGYDTFKWIGDAVDTFFSWAHSGGQFMFSPLYPPYYPNPGLAITLVAMLVFFNALLNLMKYWGVIDFIFVKAGKFLSLTLETSPVESVAVASSIFLGPAELSFMLMPYMNKLTKSELHCILTSGFASISGISMAFFLSVGAPAQHLVSAAVISAPAALCAAKLFWPETERVDFSDQTNLRVMSKEEKKSKSVLGSMSEGAMSGAAASGKMLGIMMAFYSITHMVNEILSWGGKRVGYDQLSIEVICSYLLYPVSYCMGVEEDDRRLVAELVGVKYVLTPIVSFMRLKQTQINRMVLDRYVSVYGKAYYWTDEDDIFLKETNQTLYYGVMSYKSEAICTYALAGFAAFANIGLSTGIFLALAPKRKKDVLSTLMYSFLAGSMASFYTGAVAGLMYTGDD